jgi:5'-phosphate synthase pdxT subunit
MHCGVLALQGDFAAHRDALLRIGVSAFEVRTPSDFAAAEALVIPGGESSVINTLLKLDDFRTAIVERIAGGMPVLATCCGVIVLAKGVHPEQPAFGLLDVDVTRNAYGRQISSAIVDVDLSEDFGSPSTTEGVFIRAPRITRVGDDVMVLGYRGEDPVLVKQGRIIAATFHPELSTDLRVHQYFVSLAEDCDG